MAALIFPHRWTRQPQSLTRRARDGQLGQGLIGIYTNFGGAPLLNGRLPTSNTGTPAAGAFGRGFAYSGTAQTVFPNGAMVPPGADSTHATYTGASGLSILALFDLNSLSNYNHVIAYQDSPGTVGFELRLGNGSGDSRVMLERGGFGGSSQVVASASDVFAIGKSRVLVVSAHTDRSGPADFYADGTKYSVAGSISGSDFRGTNQPLYIGRRSDGATQFDGTIYMVAVWQRRLVDAEAYAITANPWQIFEPLRRRIYLPSTAAAATTIVPSAASHSYSSNAPKLNARVAPAAGTHSYVGVAPQVKASVKPAQATHAYTGQSPQVKAKVAPAQATHTYTGQAPKTNLAVRPAQSTHTYTGQTPQAKARVSPGAASHTYTGQAPSIAAGNSISPGAATHSYTGQAPQVKAKVAVGVATHSYSGAVPSITNAPRVSPGAATHSYSGVAPQVKAKVAPGAVTHVYTGRSPATSGTTTAVAVTHIYTGQAPTFVTASTVQATAGTHTYAARTPIIVQSGVILPPGKAYRVGRRPGSASTGYKVDE